MAGWQAVVWLGWGEVVQSSGTAAGTAVRLGSLAAGAVDLLMHGSTSRAAPPSTPLSSLHLWPLWKHCCR